MLRGHLWVRDVPAYIEHIQFDGNIYLVQRPGPALILLPFVWLYGTVNQVNLSIVLGALGVAICSLLCNRGWIWLTLLFGTGTIYGYYASLGDSWAVCLVGSVPLSLLAVREILTRRQRPAVIGFFAGFATLFRYDLVFLWPFYGMLNLHPYRRFLAILSLFALFTLWFNWARFGNPLTTDISIFCKTDRQAPDGAFGLSYLPRDLEAFLFMPPNLDAKWPYIHPHYGGQALIWTTPAFIKALRVRELSSRVLLLWLMVILGLAPVLTYHAWGYVQFGYRYAIQIYPFLLGLIALHSEEEGFDQLDKILTCVSIGFVQFGAWHIRRYNWHW